jgi:hypothetical protein
VIPVETVFEAQFEVEAQMVRDLLQQAGIPARVDGAFLQSGAGELPPTGLVKVRVPPEHAMDAREIIADWEKTQPEPDTPSTGAASGAAPSTGSPSLAATRKSSWAPYTFVIGAVLGGFASWFHFNTPVTSEGVDYDGDGQYDERYVYEGNKVKSVESDRNHDGRTDRRFVYDSHGELEGVYVDNDFDGRFEALQHENRGVATLLETDLDGDGSADEIARYEHGVIKTVEFFSKSPRAAMKRSYYVGGRLSYAEYDDNGDGNFERRVEYDEKGDVKP